jgi:ribosome maturation factor RimP
MRVIELAQLKSRLEDGLVTEPLFLVEAEWTGDGGARTLRVVVDTDAGVTVEQLAALSRRIGEWLDGEDLVPFKYRLDVCSPGLERPIVHERLLRKAVGRPLRVEWRAPDEPEQPLAESRGTLRSVDEEGLELETQAGWQRILRAGAVRIRHWLDW